MLRLGVVILAWSMVLTLAACGGTPAQTEGPGERGATAAPLSVPELSDEQLELASASIEGLELQEGGDAAVSASEATEAAGVTPSDTDVAASLFTIDTPGAGASEVPEGATVWIVTHVREAAAGAGVEKEMVFTFVDANSGEPLFTAALPCTGTPC